MLLRAGCPSLHRLWQVFQAARSSYASHLRCDDPRVPWHGREEVVQKLCVVRGDLLVVRAEHLGVFIC